MFGLGERFIVAKMLEVSRHQWWGDQIALEALGCFCEEERRHQELFRPIELMIPPGSPPGYQLLPQPNEVAAAVLPKSTWAILGLISQIELFPRTPSAPQ
jgi:hypothetical protein